MTDGDTVKVLDVWRRQHRVRLAGIDAPESRQAFGKRSQQHLASLTFQKAVTVNWVKRDRYNRIVGKVTVTGRDVGLQQIQAGLAWHYKQYAHEQSPEDKVRYAEAEELAKLSRIGLWREPNPVAPWEWRKVQKPSRKLGLVSQQ